MTAKQSKHPKLRVKGATKVYHTRSGDLLAIDRCALDVMEGEIVSIVGPSGCGKTTLLWSMSGLHGLSAGEVLLDGKPVTGPNAEIGMVFQEANLLPWRNLDANINFPFEIKGTKPDRVWIGELLNRVGLEGFGGRFPRELSGGMQQRAALVRALSYKPSVLLMDEPFGALDAFTREEMNRLVEEIWLDTQNHHRADHAFHRGGDLPLRPHRGDEPAAGAGREHPRSAVPAPALAGDHVDQGGLRPHQRDQDGDRRHAAEPLPGPRRLHPARSPVRTA